MFILQFILDAGATVMLPVIIFILGPIQTPMAAAVGFEFPEGAAMIGNLDCANIVTTIFVWLSTLIAG